MVRLGEIDYDCGFLDFEVYIGRKVRRELASTFRYGVIVTTDMVLNRSTIIVIKVNYDDGSDMSYTLAHFKILLSTGVFEWLE